MFFSETEHVSQPGPLLSSRELSDGWEGVEKETKGKEKSQTVAGRAEASCVGAVLRVDLNCGGGTRYSRLRQKKVPFGDRGREWGKDTLTIMLCIVA